MIRSSHCDGHNSVHKLLSGRRDNGFMQDIMVAAGLAAPPRVSNQAEPVSL